MIAQITSYFALNYLKKVASWLILSLHKHFFKENIMNGLVN